MGRQLSFGERSSGALAVALGIELEDRAEADVPPAKAFKSAPAGPKILSLRSMLGL
jgi:hypothetical protein